MTALLVFATALALDVVWARYTITASARRATHAAWWATAIAVLSGVTAYYVVHEPWYLAPTALGAWVGTYVTVKNW